MMYSQDISKKLTLYQVDAFTDKPFGGNPAAVCLLEQPMEDSLMQAVAAEMNLSETAFLVPLHDPRGTWSLRWFTPRVEVPLCGHGTLAASLILFEELKLPGPELIYQTKSGQLTARKTEQGILLDFPVDEPIETSPAPALLEAMGISRFKRALWGRLTKKLVIELATPEDVVELRPNFEQMKNISDMDIKGVGVTAVHHGEYDFVSRYFNPWAGVNEDPVTGSVHTLLAPYWSEILHKSELKAYQASQRGGQMLLRLRDGDRLDMIGNGVIVLRGELYTGEAL